MSTSKTTRQWLSPANSDNNQSHVIVEIEEGRGEYTDHQLTICDCNRKITLEFPASKKQNRASRAKLHKLQTAIDLIWEALEEND